MTDPMHSMTLTRTVNAPARAVYAAWTVPDPMSRWLGKVEADVRPGGRYKFESDAGDGKTFVFTGEYLDLEPDRRVKQTFLAGESETPSTYPDEFIKVCLRELSETQTELTLLNDWDGDSIGEDGVEASKAGWSQWFDMMEESLSANR